MSLLKEVITPQLDNDAAYYLARHAKSELNTAVDPQYAHQVIYMQAIANTSAVASLHLSIVPTSREHVEPS
jgi:hypothetical protein